MISYHMAHSLLLVTSIVIYLSTSHLKIHMLLSKIPILYLLLVQYLIYDGSITMKIQLLWSYELLRRMVQYVAWIILSFDIRIFVRWMLILTLILNELWIKDIANKIAMYTKIDLLLLHILNKTKMTICLLITSSMLELDCIFALLMLGNLVKIHLIINSILIITNQTFMFFDHLYLKNLLLDRKI